MSGEDKGLVLFQERPLIAHVLDRLKPQVQQIIINANRNLERYRAWGYPVVEDEVDLYSGPLAGIERGLAMATTPWVAFVPCDSPFIPLNLIERLFETLIAQQSQCAYVVSAEGPQPVFCLLNKELHDDLLASLNAGHKKLIAWLHKHSYSEVFFDHNEFFINLNTQAQLEQYSHD
jgi:molybdopterin-guanine dinucleotide biosynthesis protein A